METHNYPRHQQFMLNNFIIERAGMIAAHHPTVPSTSFGLRRVFRGMRVCGSKHNVQATNSCTPVTIRRRHVSEEYRRHGLSLDFEAAVGRAI